MAKKQTQYQGVPTIAQYSATTLPTSFVVSLTPVYGEGQIPTGAPQQQPVKEQKAKGGKNSVAGAVVALLLSIVLIAAAVVGSSFLSGVIKPSFDSEEYYKAFEKYNAAENSTRADEPAATDYYDLVTRFLSAGLDEDTFDEEAYDKAVAEAKTPEEADAIDFASFYKRKGSADTALNLVNGFISGSDKIPFVQAKIVGTKDNFWENAYFINGKKYSSDEFDALKTDDISDDITELTIDGEQYYIYNDNEYNEWYLIDYEKYAEATGDDINVEDYIIAQKLTIADITDFTGYGDATNGLWLTIGLVFAVLALLLAVIALIARNKASYIFLGIFALIALIGFGAQIFRMYSYTNQDITMYNARHKGEEGFVERKLDIVKDLLNEVWYIVIPAAISLITALTGFISAGAKKKIK
jgi:flagellar basal body-associated protein FliL